MIKKLAILAVIGLFVAIGSLPQISVFMARKAFRAENINRPWAPKIAYGAGKLNMRLWRYKAGGTILKKCLETWKDAEWAGNATFQLALCYEKQGKADKAIAQYKLFLKKYPKHQWAEQARKRISNIEANKL